MSASSDGVEHSEQTYKIRERVDFEQWAFEHMLQMTKVESMGELRTYENMLNTYIISLSQYWPDGFKERWDKIRKKEHPDPRNKINDERLMDKKFLMAELIDKIGIGFTKKKKMKIKEGLLPLFRMYPPFPKSKKQ